MDLSIQQFENRLINEINSTRLPIEVKRLVVCEILSKIEAESKRIIALEQQNIKDEVEGEEK